MIAITDGRPTNKVAGHWVCKSTNRKAGWMHRKGQFLQVYITKTRTTWVSDTVFFKHQYITNPTIYLESHVVAAGHQLTIALQGNIPTGNETAEELQ